MPRTLKCECGKCLTCRNRISQQVGRAYRKKVVRLKAVRLARVERRAYPYIEDTHTQWPILL